jgi:hypothetical protein
MEHNVRNNRKDQQNHKRLKEFCPFVEDPHDDCYCFNIMNSLEISRVIHYCGKNFEECEIYKRNL